MSANTEGQSYKKKTGILFRFRLNKIAMVTDIGKAFQQIVHQDCARDVTRFFWLKDKNEIEVEKDVQVYHFCLVPFGIISSPFLLAATIDHHLKTCNSDMRQKELENTYILIMLSQGQVQFRMLKILTMLVINCSKLQQ